MKISTRDLDRLCPRPRDKYRSGIWDQYAAAFEQASSTFTAAGIGAPLEICHMMAQWAYASDGFTRLWEPGNYSAKGILRCFGPGQIANPVSKSEATRISALTNTNDERSRILFERVFGSGNPEMAAALGNANDGDGYAFRGFGIMNTRGRTEHIEKLGTDYSASNSIRLATRHWIMTRCGEAAKEDDCAEVSMLFSGSVEGLDARVHLKRQAQLIWMDAIAEPAYDGPVRFSNLTVESRKTRTMRVVQYVAIGLAGLAVLPFGIAVAGALSIVLGVADARNSIGSIAQIIALLQDMARDHVTPILFGVSLLMFAVSRLIMKFVSEDLEEGRYRPRET